ncbi:MAG: hypothetical protein K2Q06_01895 [Parvularculaceae bacterium]|nr:hypothetical protein [Parvularculaceae bacterium]
MMVALTAYGSAATSSAHAHAYSGFHGVHSAGVHHHAGDAADHHNDTLDHDAGQPIGGDPLSPVSEHHENGFHSHAAPQFGAVEAMTAFAAALPSRHTLFFNPDRMAAKARDESPFKPPRILL